MGNVVLLEALAKAGDEIGAGGVVLFDIAWLGMFLFVDIEFIARLELTEFCWTTSSKVGFKSVDAFFFR